MAGKQEKGLIRGGIGGQEGELENKIMPAGSLESERRPLPGDELGGSRPRARNPFMDQESQAALDRENQRK